MQFNRVIGLFSLVLTFEGSYIHVAMGNTGRLSPPILLCLKREREECKREEERERRERGEERERARERRGLREEERRGERERERERVMFTSGE